MTKKYKPFEMDKEVEACLPLLSIRNRIDKDDFIDLLMKKIENDFYIDLCNRLKSGDIGSTCIKER